MGKRSCLCLVILLAATSAGAADAGDLLWAKEVNGAYGTAAAAFPDGSWGVAGNFGGSAVFGAGEPNATTLVSAGGPDMFVARYNADGTLAWARRAGGSESEDTGTGLAAFPDGSLVVAGYFIGSADFGTGGPNATTLVGAGGADIFVARYNANGTLAWARRAGSPNAGGAGDVAYAVAAFPDGSSVVTGYFEGEAVFGAGEPNVTTLVSTSYSSIFVARYNANGTLAWARREGGSYQGASAATDVARGVAAFPDGSSVVTGNFLGSVESGGAVVFGAGGPNATTLSSGRNGAIFVVRYNPDGTLAWAHAAGGGSLHDTDSVDVGFAVSSFPDGSSVVTGRFFDSRAVHAAFLDGAVFGPGEPNETTLIAAGSWDVFVARYNADGTLAWARRAGGTELDIGQGVAALPDGSSVVTGQFGGPAVFGAGEPNETTLTGGRAFIARYAGNAGITAPQAIVRECDDGTEGATVNFVFEITAGSADLLRVRDVTGVRPLLEVSAPADGSYGVGAVTFPHGGSTVAIELIAGSIVVATASFTVQVEDTVAPVLMGCAPRMIELQGPLTTLSMPLLGITVSDACDPTPSVTFDPGALGLGTSQVTATARDATGNVASCTFDVTVVDTTPPAFTVCPEDIGRECQGAGGALVSFDVLAEDLSGQVAISCTDAEGRDVSPSGTLFAVGDHNVTCTATDSSGNAATCSFRVAVVDVAAPAIVCPDDITVTTAPGACYAFVEFAITATDACDPDVAIECAAPWGAVESGDAFPVGSTTVTCTARDHAGNVATCSFNVTVEDREPPVLSGPASATLVTDCAGNALLVSAASLGVTATDNCDPVVTIVVAPASIGPGITEVICTARDDDGNESRHAVQVTVLRGPFEWQFLRPLDGGVDNLIRSGQTVPLKLKVTCDNLFEAGATAVIESVVRVDEQGTPVANDTVADSGLANDGGSLMRLAGGHYAYNLSTRDWSSASGLRFRVTVTVAKPGHADTHCAIVLKNR